MSAAKIGSEFVVILPRPQLSDSLRNSSALLVFDFINGTLLLATGRNIGSSESHRSFSQIKDQ
jgi:hypothetical protein